jgi:hypothetical protein
MRQARKSEDMAKDVRGLMEGEKNQRRGSTILEAATFCLRQEWEHRRNRPAPCFEAPKV